MKKLFCILVVLLACPLAVMPAAAQQCGIPADANSDGNLTQEELASAIVSYMLGGGDLKLEDLRDAAFIYAYWTPETAGNFTLTVFGNANGDDTIDVRDLIYIREVIS
ncbi:MAG: ABC-type Fe3+-hydroxamate transport system, periplasmic component, partial [Methanosarcinales archeaon 56_1174]